jgi:hypothetical protein
MNGTKWLDGAAAKGTPQMLGRESRAYRHLSRVPGSQ